jgi:HAD superfamily hydrolase (TIGR01509 family)
MYRAVIFDIDGTLVDSNDAHGEAWVEALTERGRRVTFERVRPLIGMGGDKLLPEVAGISADSAEGQAISERRREIFRQRFLPTLQPTRGANALLEHLRDDRMTLVVASSAQASEIDSLLQVANAAKLFESKASSDDAERSKPDPDIVQAAIDRTGCPREEVMMIGDTPYDIEAALRAGIGIVALRCGGWRDDALGKALAIYDDPADLLEHYDVSPFKRPQKFPFLRPA